MNTSKIKSYAIQARRDFLKAVTERANIYGIFADDHIESIKTRSQGIEKVGAKVDDMEKIINTVEARMRDLAREKVLIREAENRIKGLNLLMEDIKAQIKNLTAEEKQILTAIEKTSELRFLLGEVESKLNVLRQEKDKLID